MVPGAKRSLLGHAFLLWVLCAATMGLGQTVTTLAGALILHATAAPFLAAGVAGHYFRRWRGIPPSRAALTFVVVALALDFLLVASLVLHSMALFRSWLGTWLPLGLIFVSSYLTGHWHARRFTPRR